MIRNDRVHFIVADEYLINDDIMTNYYELLNE